MDISLRQGGFEAFESPLRRMNVEVTARALPNAAACISP